MYRLAATLCVLLLATTAFAADPGSRRHGAGEVGRPSPVPGTGPGSASFDAYLHSHSGLARFNDRMVPGTGPGSASFDAYLASHAGLARFNRPTGPVMPTMPLH